MPSCFNDLAHLQVQALDGVGGVDDLADRRVVIQKRDEPVPGVLPGRDDGLVAPAELGLGEGQQRGLGRIGCGGSVDRPQRGLLVGDISQARGGPMLDEEGYAIGVIKMRLEQSSAMLLSVRGQAVEAAQRASRRRAGALR